MKIEMDNRFKTRMSATLTDRTLEVGILKNRTHYAAKRNSYTSFNGKKVRNIDKTKPSGTIRSIARIMTKKSGVNIFKVPFLKASKDFHRFKEEFVRLILNQGGTVVRARELLAACVTMPIIRKSYGPNSSKTKRSKGFNWRFVDTAQVLSGITARIRKIK